MTGILTVTKAGRTTASWSKPLACKEQSHRVGRTTASWSKPLACMVYLRHHAWNHRKANSYSEIAKARIRQNASN
jgi:hypothetical protein